MRRERDLGRRRRAAGQTHIARISRGHAPCPAERAPPAVRAGRRGPPRAGVREVAPPESDGG